MARPLFSIIIPSYNGANYLQACLKSLFSSNIRNAEIIIIDDNSTDETKKMLSSVKSKKIQVITNQQNQGAAKCRNIAAQHAKGKFLVFLDNDTRVSRNWLKNLYNTICSSPSIGAAQSLLLDFENPKIIQMAGGKLIKETGWQVPLLQGELFDRIKGNLSQDSIIGVSASLMVKKDVFDKVRGFDTAEGVFTEDIDFCWRIWLMGFRVVLSPESIVYHYTKTLSSRKDMHHSRSVIYFHLAKNAIRSMLKNYSWGKCVLYIPFTILINMFRSVLTRSLQPIVATTKSIWWNIINLSDTLNNRAYIQVNRKVSDDELFALAGYSKNVIAAYQEAFL